MRIALALLCSLIAATAGGLLMSRIETFLMRAPEYVVTPIAFVLFFGTIALSWAPWFILTRKR